MTNTTVFVLDNQDSFTYNLVDELTVLGFNCKIYRNTLSADYIYQQIEQCAGNKVLLLSPGPGNPSNAGCLLELIQLCADKVAILGICLGHQALVQHFGGKVVKAPVAVHGKAAIVQVVEHPIFAQLPQQLTVARYHSLVTEQLPAQINTIAEVDDLVMAIAHNQLPIIGFQFHPESILTCHGSQLLAQTLNFLTQQG